jgi:hypothetical protein
MGVIASPYFPIFIIIAIFSAVTANARGRKYTNILLFISFVILALLAGLREFSPDQKTYALTFKETRSIFDLMIYGINYEDLEMEWGFLFLLSIIKTLTSNVTVMFILLSSINVGIVVYACKKLSPYPILSVLIYYSWFFYSNLGALRHAFISSLLLLTVVFVVNNKFLKSWFLYIASASFHKVGLFVIIVFLVKKIKPKLGKYLFILSFSFVAAVFGGLFYASFDLLYYYFPESWQNKMNLYIEFSSNGAFDTDFAGKESIIKGTTIKQLFIVLTSMVYYPILRGKFNDKFNIVFGVYLSSIILLLLFIDFKVASDRVSSYLAISEIILIPMLLTIVSLRERALILFVIFGVLFVQISMLYGNQLYLYKLVL